MQAVIGAETLPGKRQATNAPKPYPPRVRCSQGAVAPPKDLHSWASRPCCGPSCWDPQVSAGQLVQHGPRARAVVCGAKVKGPTIRYVCRECGVSEPREYGRCPNCKKYGTYDAEEVNAPVSTGGGVGISAMQRATSAVKQLRPKSTPAVYNGDDEPDYYTDLAAGAVKAQPTNRSWVSNARLGITSPISLRDMSSKSYTARSPGRMVLTGRTGQEINRVLGGGVVSGSLVLVGGEPGVGKSTLSLQIAAMIAQPDLDYDALSETDEQKDGSSDTGNEASPDTDGRDLIVMPPAQSAAPQTVGSAGPKAKRRQGSQASATPGPGPGTSPEPVLSPLQEVQQSNGTHVSSSPEGNGTHMQGDSPPVTTRAVLYVSGEETCDQVYDRALRMGLQNCDTLHVLAECRMEVILRQTLLMRPAALVVDSLQTLFLSDLDNVSGAVVQLKECTSALLRLAKDHGITVFAIGHVTKTSDLAGPKAMEHMVDAVLKLEGDMSQSYRVLRAGKNRFGTTDEVGVFCMDVGGLHAVSNPSSMFLANRSSGSSAVAVILDGTRVLVLEVQALVTACYPGSKSPPVRQSSGAPKDRVFAIIINVLHKFVARMSNQNVVVNVTGGMQMREPAADLAIAVAIASSYYNLPVPKDIAAIGEIDLGGGLRPVRCLDMRLMELAKLGLKSIVIPNVPEVAKLQRDPRLAGVTLHPCDTLLQALQVVLGPEVGVRRGKGKGRPKAKQAADDDEDMEEEEEEDED